MSGPEEDGRPTQAESESALLPLFCSVRRSWVGNAHRAGAGVMALLSSPAQMLVSSGNPCTDTSSNNDHQLPGHPLAQSG